MTRVRSRDLECFFCVCRKDWQLLLRVSPLLHDNRVARWQRATNGRSDRVAVQFHAYTLCRSIDLISSVKRTLLLVLYVQLLFVLCVCVAIPWQTLQLKRHVFLCDISILSHSEYVPPPTPTPLLFKKDFSHARLCLSYNCLQQGFVKRSHSRDVLVESSCQHEIKELYF